MDHEHNADINDLLSEFRKQHDENSVAAHWAQADALPRRVVQISAVAYTNSTRVFALCSDGTVWKYKAHSSYTGDPQQGWKRLPAIPQGDR